MLEFKITLDDIDFDSVVDYLWPVISNRLEEQLDTGSGASRLLGRLLNKSQSFNAAAAKGLIGALPDDKKEALISKCINGGSEEIADFFEKELSAQKVYLEVKAVSVETR